MTAPLKTSSGGCGAQPLAPYLSVRRKGSKRGLGKSAEGSFFLPGGGILVEFNV